ncbi:succinylglutamate desuccinylase/aspartoacylase family protein [Elongatibacter sediminis]|uniref:Succinylglutamate desuccinylase/aspartoacylase family protein n=1 Tax=Elongatibacter sediminis TaxID=3119006 RepID=A0AAW9RIR5_9GAMM
MNRTPKRAAWWLLGLALLPLTSSAVQWGPIEVAGREIWPGQSQRFPYGGETSFESAYLDAPVFVARGVRYGPTLCVTAGIHGDEINGTEIARRTFSWVDPEALTGTMVVFPMVNAAGVRTGNRYMQDRRDLNREFPGRSDGSVTAIVAYTLFSEITRLCDSLIDLHTGSFSRTNHPQVRVGSDNPKALEMARSFGVGLIVLSNGPRGSLRREAMDRGIPAIIYEAGEPLRFDLEQISAGVRGIESIMAHLGMMRGRSTIETPDSRIYTTTTWVRVPVGAGGYFFPSTELGQRVNKGQRLGTIIDPLTDRQTRIEAATDGEVIGLAAAQIVLSGYALVHLGVSHR